MPLTSAISAVAVAPPNAKIASIRFLFCVRSAMAPISGTISTWMTVAKASR